MKQNYNSFNIKPAGVREGGPPLGHVDDWLPFLRSILESKRNLPKKSEGGTFRAGSCVLFYRDGVPFTGYALLPEDGLCPSCLTHGQVSPAAQKLSRLLAGNLMSTWPFCGQSIFSQSLRPRRPRSQGGGEHSGKIHLLAP